MSRPCRSNAKTMNKVGKLRLESTPAEWKLWSVVRGNKLHGIKFRCQHTIGNYIVDFVSIKKILIIELDGSQPLNKPNTMKGEPDIWNRRAIEWSVFEIIRSKRKWMGLFK